MPSQPPAAPAQSRASKLANAHDDLIRAALPAWLSGASPEAINRLRDAFAALHGTQTALKVALGHLEPLEAFAMRWLERRVGGLLPGRPALHSAVWREARLRLEPPAFVGVNRALPTGDVYYVRMPAVQRLLQNFERDVSFWQGTALVDAEDEHILYDDPGRLARLCRDVDVGGRYQAHLKTVLTPAVQQILAREQRQSLAVSVQVAVLKQQLRGADSEMLEQLVAGQPLWHRQGIEVRTRALTVLGYPVGGALVFELLGQWAAPPAPIGWSSVEGLILYLPDDPQPLQRFATWSALAERLGEALRDARYRQRFCQRLALGDRLAFMATLGKRLLDARTDPQPDGTPIVGDVFAWLAQAHMQRVEADAGWLAVPTAQVDRHAREARLQALADAGVALVNLVGLFVPVVGLAMMSSLIAETLMEVFEGVADWAQGHEHEALEHMLGVAETVAMTAVQGAGIHWVARGFERSAWVDGLEPVSGPTGQPRLQAMNLGAYRVKAPPAELERHANGLLGAQGRYWWRDQGDYYEVMQVDNQWQLRHPEQGQGRHPVLLHNGERGWRLRCQRPLEWQGAQRLLGYLWPEVVDMEPALVARILQVADVDEAQLRGVLVENRRLPVQLRDTLERFAAHARIEAFLDRAAAGVVQVQDQDLLDWCLERFAAHDWPVARQLEALGEQQGKVREGLLAHLTRHWLPTEPLAALIKRDFPGMPEAYAGRLLERATAAQRRFMTDHGRIPLALAEQARPLLQTARLTRVREAFHLPGSHHQDAVALAFDLLRQNAAWPASVNLELREGSDTGRLLARLHTDGDALVMVRREGGFSLFTHAGHRFASAPAEPAGLGEVLAVCLPESERLRLGWNGTDAPLRIRQALMQWLPNEREALMRRLGMRPLDAWMHPAWRQADGRIGYPLSGLVRRLDALWPERLLRRRIRALYPGFDDVAVQEHLERLLDMTGSPFANLLSEEQAYRDLCASLSDWEIQEAAYLRPRQQLASQLRRCWRREVERVPGSMPQRTRLALVGVLPGNLPMLPLSVTFPHVTELVMVGLGLERMPQRFLRAFPQVRWLNLTFNRFTALPPELPQLREMRSLWLHNNQIRLDGLGRALLRHMPQLEVLDLSDNPLRRTDLNLNSFSRLREVQLRRTLLDAIPDGLQRLAMLEWVDLRDNAITHLPDFLRQWPWSARQRFRLDDNPLSAADVALWRREGEPFASSQAEPEVWLEGLAGHDQALLRRHWEALFAEPGSGDFFALLDALTDSSDFQRARASLRERVTRMLTAMVHSQSLREELFSLASAPRTCADSVAGCFSNLEVREWLHSALRTAAPAEGQRVRLDLAKRLFRLDKVEQLAREHMQHQSAVGQEVDEVEVSLAYRSGLAPSLGLPGQPRTLRFATVSDVTQADLDAAAIAVRQAEASNELARYIAGRDFWQDYLRQQNPQRLDAVEQPFWDQLEALEKAQPSMSDGAYDARMREVAKGRAAAIDGLFLRLTGQALAEQADTGAR